MCFESANALFLNVADFSSLVQRLPSITSFRGLAEFSIRISVCSCQAPAETPELLPQGGLYASVPSLAAAPDPPTQASALIGCQCLSVMAAVAGGALR